MNDFVSTMVASFAAGLLVLAVIALVAWRGRSKPVPAPPAASESPAVAPTAVEAPTREHDVLDLDALGVRQLRQIHGLTAPELATVRAADERRDEWEWARITQDLSCDADFRAIATGLEAEFPKT